MDASFCVAALEEALARYGKPEFFNTDQGSQFTSATFTGVLIEAGVRISMDGRGRWMDNIERVWRSVKYEDVYLKGYGDGREAKAGIGAYFAFYNERRLHQALGYRAPLAVWRDGAAPAAYGHVDNARALTTCPQAHQNQQQTDVNRHGIFRADRHPIGTPGIRVHTGLLVVWGAEFEMLVVETIAKRIFRGR